MAGARRFHILSSLNNSVLVDFINELLVCSRRISGFIDSSTTIYDIYAALRKTEGVFRIRATVPTHFYLGMYCSDKTNFFELH